MTDVSVKIQNVQGFGSLEVSFDFSEQNLIVFTGKNGIGKTTIVKAFSQINDPTVFTTTSSEGALSDGSEVVICLAEDQQISYKYDKKQKVLDTKDSLPDNKAAIAELPAPHGTRFKHYSSIAAQDSNLKGNYASSQYSPANELKQFLMNVYGELAEARYTNLCQTEIKGETYYFIPQEKEYYLREDHFSSGEYFLIQLYRFIQRGARFMIVDEVDIALDAMAQVNLYSAIRSLLVGKNCNVVLISHSLALMKQTPDGALYYLEKLDAGLSLAPRSFGYINSDLYGFKGLDKYIITEDPVLEGFIKFVIRHYEIKPDYEFTVIGVGGCDQVRTLLEKNEKEELFSTAENVLGIIDADVHADFLITFNGQTEVASTLVQDIELYIYENREQLLPELAPPYRQSSKSKKASKTYWAWLTENNHRSPIELFKILITNKDEEIRPLVEKLNSFLTRQ